MIYPSHTQINQSAESHNIFPVVADNNEEKQKKNDE